MAFIGERAFLERQLDDLWELMCELEDEAKTASAERRVAIGHVCDAYKKDFDYYFKRLQECEIPWWKS